MPRPNAMGRPKPKIEDPMGKLKRLFVIFLRIMDCIVFLFSCVLLSVYLPMYRELCLHNR